MTRAALAARSRFCNDFRLASAPLAVPSVPRRRGAARAMDDQLSRYRQSIDNIDAAPGYMIAERFQVKKAVGGLKADRKSVVKGKREAVRLDRGGRRLKDKKTTQ